MPEAKAVKPYITFVRGLISEASPLTYPEDASIEEENFILNRDGSRQRRLGIDYENSYALSSNIATNVFSDLAVTTHIWTNVANCGRTTFAVVQAGTILYFYDLAVESQSGNKKSFTVDLEDFKTAFPVNMGARPIAVTTGIGALFVVSRDTEPFMIEYD